MKLTKIINSRDASASLVAAYLAELWLILILLSVVGLLEHDGYQ